MPVKILDETDPRAKHNSKSMVLENFGGHIRQLKSLNNDNKLSQSSLENFYKVPMHQKIRLN
jgi:hypothetical protein